MSNTYFRFKQFIIHQDQCAMKVCTDACILGAWFAKKFSSPGKVLDIGAGTGLLMLMLAQKNDTLIHGIELDVDCFKQLEENTSKSNWTERLTVYQGDVRSFSFPGKYDFIITNPPFFENDLQSLTASATLAKHSPELTFKQLVESIDKNLSDDGSFGILLPFDRWEYFQELSAQRHFHLCEKLFIRHSPSHHFSRAILYYSRHKQNVISSFEMNVYKGSTEGYTDDFVELLSDYYLYL